MGAHRIRPERFSVRGARNVCGTAVEGRVTHHEVEPAPREQTSRARILGVRGLSCRLSDMDARFCGVHREWDKRWSVWRGSHDADAVLKPVALHVLECASKRDIIDVLPGNQ